MKSKTLISAAMGAALTVGAASAYAGAVTLDPTGGLGFGPITADEFKFTVVPTVPAGVNEVTLTPGGPAGPMGDTISAPDLVLYLDEAFLMGVSVASFGPPAVPPGSVGTPPESPFRLTADLTGVIDTVAAFPGLTSVSTSLSGVDAHFYAETNGVEGLGVGDFDLATLDLLFGTASATFAGIPNDSTLMSGILGLSGVTFEFSAVPGPGVWEADGTDVHTILTSGPPPSPPQLLAVGSGVLTKTSGTPGVTPLVYDVGSGEITATVVMPEPGSLSLLGLGLLGIGAAVRRRREKKENV